MSVGGRSEEPEAKPKPAIYVISRRRRTPADSVEQVKGRYARGEITRDEFQQIVQDLAQVAATGHNAGGEARKPFA
ncbi:MAG: SHOCT domain-containing protein [Chloroflexi bacterium]|nr:MAG: SHOCT domain-containing protein [Chloroflexota bacterium]